MAKTVIGRLSAVLSLSNKAFNAGLSKSSGRLRKFGKIAKGVGLMVGALGGVVLGAAVGLFAFVRAHVKALDAQIKFSKRLGIVIGRLQGLHVAAKLAGVDINQLNIGMQRMGRRVAEAAQGMGEAQGALKELGLDARDLAKLSIDRQFLAIAAAMGAVKTRGDQVRLTFKLFDSEGVSVLNILDMGTDRLAKIANFAQKIGATIDKDTARGVERTADALTMAQVAWEGMKNVIAVAFMPHVEKLALNFAKWVSDSDNLKAAIKDIGVATMEVFEKLEPVLSVFATADKTLRWFSEKYKDVKFGIDAVINFDKKAMGPAFPDDGSTSAERVMGGRAFEKPLAQVGWRHLLGAIPGGDPLRFARGHGVESTTDRIEAHTQFMGTLQSQRQQGIPLDPHQLVRMREGMGDISGNFQNMTPAGAAVSR